MAAIGIQFFSPYDNGGHSIYPAMSRKAETVTSSGTSAQTTNTALQGDFARIEVPSGARVAILTGSSNPVATASAVGAWTLSAGVMEIGPLSAGWEIAVIDI